jgi:general secretion pathway protein K
MMTTAATMKSLNNQKGIALITVLLVMALVAVMAVNMTFAQHIDIRRTGNLLDGDQAMVLALGLEEWGRQVLIRDVAKGNNDHFGEDWAMGLMPTATENGMISGSIVDLQGRINLNNLAVGSPANVEQTALRLERIFDLCEIEGGSALVLALADWLDEDEQIRPGGAEDNEYLLHEPPYLAGNRLLTSPSELLLVEGGSPDNYGCLAEHITALPIATPINVNTADAVVIATLSGKISVADAVEIVKDRPENGYVALADFFAHPNLAGSGISAEGLAMASDYFMIEGQAVFGEAEIGLYSLIARRSGMVEVFGRSIGTY